MLYKQIPAWLMVFTIWLAACSPGLPVISVPTGTEAVPTETPELPQASPTTPNPSPTTEPTPGRVFLLAPSESDPVLFGEVQSVLEKLVPQAGYQLEITPALSPDEITRDMRLVVGLPPDPGMERLAASASGTRFFAIGIPGLNETPNLTSASLQRDGADLQGFMGGVVAALVTPDWRIGMISLSDTQEGAQARESFINGAVYFCGTCRQIYPPFFDSQNQLIQYPLYVELPSTATDTEWQSAAGYLIERGVETIFVFPGAGGQALLDYLAESGANIIGGTVPPDGFQDNWVASIYSEPSNSWQALLETALLGGEPAEAAGELQIGYVNPDLMSPGRQKLAEEVLADLLAGYIEVGNLEEPANEP